jgi:hypothetical protein
MPDTKTVTRPSRKRAETKVETPKAEAKKATSKPAKVEAETDAVEDAKTRILVVMEHAGDTKTYSKWQPPKDSGCVGTYYAPLGTEVVKVLLEGPAS